MAQYWQLDILEFPDPEVSRRSIRQARGHAVSEGATVEVSDWLPLHTYLEFQELLHILREALRLIIAQSLKEVEVAHLIEETRHVHCVHDCFGHDLQALCGQINNLLDWLLFDP